MESLTEKIKRETVRVRGIRNGESMSARAGHKSRGTGGKASAIPNEIREGEQSADSSPPDTAKSWCASGGTRIRIDSIGKSDYLENFLEQNSGQIGPRAASRVRRDIVGVTAPRCSVYGTFFLLIARRRYIL